MNYRIRGQTTRELNHSLYYDCWIYDVMMTYALRHNSHEARAERFVLILSRMVSVSTGKATS